MGQLLTIQDCLVILNYINLLLLYFPCYLEIVTITLLYVLHTDKAIILH